MKPKPIASSTIDITPVDPAQTEMLLRLYIDLFYDREPLTKCIGMSKDRMMSFARSMYGGANNPISQGFCWVARDRSVEDKEIGFIVCDDPVSEENQEVPDDVSKQELAVFSSVMALLEDVRKPVKERIGTEAGTCLHVAAVGVALGYEGAGIATNLLQTALDQARAQKFSHVFAECTSMGSRRCHEKLGFQCLHSVAVDESSTNDIQSFAQDDLCIYLLWKDL